MQLFEKKIKLVEVQERSATYMQQINQLLQNKFSDHCRYEELQVQNMQLRRELKEFQQKQGIGDLAGEGAAYNNG